MNKIAQLRVRKYDKKRMSLEARVTEGPMTFVYVEKIGRGKTRGHNQFRNLEPNNKIWLCSLQVVHMWDRQ